MSDKLVLPEGKSRLLLHSCCAPCSCGIMDTLRSSDIRFSVFFYNPNIEPYVEYCLRKDENKRYADKLKVDFYDADYDYDFWLKMTEGLEHEPERGKRCSVCFHARLARTAGFALNNGFDIITTSLGISRWKDFDQVTSCGRRAALEYNVAYWDINWRKNGGTEKMMKIISSEKFYRQKYCGCRYSQRNLSV